MRRMDPKLNLNGAARRWNFDRIDSLPGMSMHRIAIVSFAILQLTSPAFAHGGGLNAQGCHNNRKTGDYHCHRSPSGVQAPRLPPVRSGRSSFRNCSEARAAGAAPVYRGDPGYRLHLDRDGDGVGCEPFSRTLEMPGLAR